MREHLYNDRHTHSLPLYHLKTLYCPTSGMMESIILGCIALYIFLYAMSHSLYSKRCWGVKEGPVINMLLHKEMRQATTRASSHVEIRRVLGYFTLLKHILQQPPPNSLLEFGNMGGSISGLFFSKQAQFSKFL